MQIEEAKMNYREQLENLIEDQEGLILTRDVTASGIPSAYLSNLVQDGTLERVAHGVYLARDAFDDEMFRLQAKNKRIVFSHETALFFHDLTDRDPIEWSVTVPYGYNATHLRKEGMKVYTVKKDLHLLAVTKLQSAYGRPILAYDQERTICDILRNRNNMDAAVLSRSLQNYVHRQDKNIPLLLRYAKQLNIYHLARTYMAILHQPL